MFVLLTRPVEDESLQNVVHEVLKRLGGVAQADGHEGELEKADWSGDGCLPCIVRMDCGMVVGSHQVDHGEDGTPEKLVGVIIDMTDGVRSGP